VKEPQLFCKLRDLKVWKPYCFEVHLFVIGLINIVVLHITFVCSAGVINSCSILTQTSFISFVLSDTCSLTQALYLFLFALSLLGTIVFPKQV